MADRRKHFPRELDNGVVRKQGLIIHYVFHPIQGYCNCHTHGLAEFNHADLQLVMDIGPKNAQRVLAFLINRIKSGETFIPLMRYDGVIQSYQVSFIPAREDGREVLRLVFPDNKGELRQDLMHPFCASQYHLIT